MTFTEAFEHSLSDYLMKMKVKNISGVTLVEQRPVSDACKWHILDISYAEVVPHPGRFVVRIYCNQNLPSAEQVLPEKSSSSKKDITESLETMYKPWIRSMRFRVESPPKTIGGVYDHFEFTIDENGSISSVSDIIIQWDYCQLPVFKGFLESSASKHYSL